MSVKYLETKIEERRMTLTPNYGRTTDGYTLRSGAPTGWMIRLSGETRFRRLMVWCWSNAGTLFVRVKGEPHIVRDHDLPLEREERGHDEQRR